MRPYCARHGQHRIPTSDQPGTWVTVARFGMTVIEDLLRLGPLPSADPRSIPDPRTTVGPVIRMTARSQRRISGYSDYGGRFCAVRWYSASRRPASRSNQACCAWPEKCKALRAEATTMQRVRHYLSWFLMLAVVAISLASAGCVIRSRYRDRDRHRDHDRTSHEYQAEQYDRHR